MKMRYASERPKRARRRTFLQLNYHPVALPPKGDPLRPLHLAAGSCTTLGVFFLLIAALAIVAMLALSANWFIGFVGGFYLVIGTVLFVVGRFIRRERGWAIITGIVIASLMLALTLISLMSTVITAMMMSSAGPGGPTEWVMPAIMLLFVLAFAQLLYHLIRGRKNLREAATPGFEPLNVTPRPVLPIEEH